MPNLNINRIFSDKKAPTIPEVAVPKNIKQSLCIDKVCENGIFKIEPVKAAAMYDRCYLFEDINYVNKDEDRQSDTLLELMKLFKGMSGHYKITIASEQTDMDAFMEDVFAPVHKDEYPLLAEGIGCFINQKIEEGVRDIRRMLLLTVTCRANSFEEAESYFATIDTSLHKTFASLRSRLYRMSGTERLALLQRMLRAGGIGIVPEGISPDRDGWKNQILPAYIEQDMDYLKLDDRYACVLFAHDYAQRLREDKLMHSLTEQMFPTYVTLDIEPVPQKLIKDQLMNSYANNERSIEQEKDKKRRQGILSSEVSYQKAKKKENLERDLEQMENNDEEGMFLGFLVMVTAESLEELTARVDTLKQAAVDNYFTLTPYYHRQLKALNTVLPVGGRQVDHMRFFFTSSAVAFQPFYSGDLQDSSGYVFGLNETTKHLLRGNRKQLRAPHAMYVGNTGSGKSFFIKEVDIAQVLLNTDEDLIVLDPHNEQQEFITSLKGGQYFDLTPHCQIYLNPFEVPDYVMEGGRVVREKFVADMKSYAGTFCTAVMTNIVVTQVHLTYISRAVDQMYEEYFSKKISRKSDIPTWIRVRELLEKAVDKTEYLDERRMLLDIVVSLEEYTIGAYDMFAHPSNKDMHSRLIGFGLQNIPETAWEPAMLTIMQFLTMRVEYDLERHVALNLEIDEAQVLSKKKATVKHFLYMAETFRKKGAQLTFAFQNLTQVLQHPDLCAVLSACPFKCFFDQGGVDAQELAKIQELSTVEYAALSGKEPGHGVVVWDGQVYLMDARMDKSNVLYPLFNTNPNEKDQKAEEKEEP